MSASHTPAARITPTTVEFQSPNVIGATGGSGTRVFARIVRAGGLFIGSEVNESEDAVALGDYSDRWINRYSAGSTPPRPALLTEMAVDLWGLLNAHTASLPAEPMAWGWKEPRSIFLLPFLHKVLPRLRFLHVVRDGRDMAVSANQNQLAKHGDAVLGSGLRNGPDALRSILLWSHVNSAAADYGERHLGDRYLRLRFEDLCAAPARSVERVLAFFNLRGDPVDIARREVSPPPTLGRWCQYPRGLVQDWARLAGPALRRFGYL